MVKRMHIVLIAACFLSVGCQTVHDTGEQVGTVIGKGADAVGGITEGAAEGYVGTTPTSDENPFGR